MWYTFSDLTNCSTIRRFCLLPEEKFCRECWMYKTNILSSHHFPSILSLLEDAEESSESSSAENHSALLDDSLVAFKVSSFKSTGKSKHQKLIQANKNIDKVTKKLEKAFAIKGLIQLPVLHHQI